MQLDESSLNFSEVSLLMQAEVAIEERRMSCSKKAGDGAARTPYKVLLNGYCGAGNIGADIRTGEIIRQLLALFPADQVRLFYTCSQPLDYEPFSLIGVEGREVGANEFLSDYDGVIIVEGSVFKSNFSNVMAISFISALALAAAEGKLSVAYGAEAGQMSAEVSDFAKVNSEDSLVVARSQESFEIVSDELGYRAVLGADTAWTYQPSSPELGSKLLKQAGWDGQTQVVCIAPINPFCWPAKPDFKKYAELKESGKHRESHCRSVFFYNDSAEAKARYEEYISSIARAIGRYSETSTIFPVLIGMESLDRKACLDLKDELGVDVPMFVSSEYTADEVVSILRAGSMVISSRYHALVTSMPANVPGIGITIDERITNLMFDRGCPELVVDVSSPCLSDELFALMQKVSNRDIEPLEELDSFMARQLSRISDMGRALCCEVSSKLPYVDVPDKDSDMKAFLPELSSEVRSILGYTE